LGAHRREKRRRERMVVSLATIGRWRRCWVVQLVRERGWQGDRAAERREKREGSPDL
jgi:hypothetical protein